MKVLSKIAGNLRNNLKLGSLFPTAQTITFRPESGTCPQCRTTAKVLKTSTKPVATLAIGAFIARELQYFCPRCGLVLGSEELKQLVPERCNIGYDVLAYVGEAFFLGSRDNEQIMVNLKEKNVSVCRSEVSYLAKKFIVYLAMLHKEARKETRALLSMNGGYVLHLDGTCEGESPHLISVLDGITEIVLDNTKVPSENAGDLIGFLKSVQAAYGDPVAVVSDMGKGIVSAVKDVFKHVPLFICHYHFLKSVGKELFGEENDTIRKRLKNHGVQGALRKRVRTLRRTIAASPPQLVETFLKLIETDELTTEGPTEGLAQIIIHTLVEWVLDGKNQGAGRGFPFDQVYLIFYQRLVRAYALLGQFIKSDLLRSTKEKNLYHTIRRDIQPVIRDSVLRKASARMLEKVDVFNRLRSAMRITLADNKRGLNDDGELCNIKTIEKEVTKFRHRLSRDENRMKDKAYQKLINQVNKYWHMLFCDPIVVETKAGKIVIQPQRTNTILEQFFRALMRAYRKKNGFQAMARALKAMLKDTPLVMNLRNTDYMKILLGGKTSLAQRFADIDAQMVRREMNTSTGTDYSIDAKLKKAVTASTLPESLITLIDKEASNKTGTIRAPIQIHIAPASPKIQIRNAS